ncbi:MAG: HPF/RaiA family ribosome-associated protein [Planctomycetes bacterium]|nr:HPF/RaiA family ribosome-associated protein [Planctomycetota bacterium]
MAAKKKTQGSRKVPLGTRPGSAKDLGRTDAAETPLDVRTQGVRVSDEMLAHVHEKLGARLGKHAVHIDRVTVRFEDLNGPRGGVDTECRVQVSMPSRPLLVVTERSTNPRKAFDALLSSLTRAVKRDIERSGHTAGKGAARQRTVARAKAKVLNAPPTDGSLIGRRVGGTDANLAKAGERPEKSRGDAWVDTSLPGVSATDRVVGGGSTARRNTKGKTPRSAAALEDSAQTRPSRTSTRKSANRTKSGQGLAERAVSRTHAPGQRASAAKARARRATGPRT